MVILKFYIYEDQTENDVHTESIYLKIIIIVICTNWSCISMFLVYRKLHRNYTVIVKKIINFFFAHSELKYHIASFFEDETITLTAYGIKYKKDILWDIK